MAASGGASPDLPPPPGPTRAPLRPARPGPPPPAHLLVELRGRHLLQVLQVGVEEPAADERHAQQGLHDVADGAVVRQPDPLGCAQEVAPTAGGKGLPMSRGGSPGPPGNRAGPHQAEVTLSQEAGLREEGDAAAEQDRTTSASPAAGAAAGSSPPPSPGPDTAPSSVPAWAFSASRGFLGAARGPAQWRLGLAAHPLWCLLAGGGKCWGLRLSLTCA